MSINPNRRSRAIVPLVIAALSAPLAACSAVDREIPTSTIATDYHQRHPVVLANAPEKLDIFPVGPTGKLDNEQRELVRQFAKSYRAHGQGQLVALLPSGNGREAAAAITLEAIRRELARERIPGSVSVGTYPAYDPKLAAPVQLSFVTLQAEVHHCGDWPEDLGAGSGTSGFANRTYWNFGCATQKTLAAQVADPRDLARPRAEDPEDVMMRTRPIGAIRAGTSPTTAW